MRIFYNKSVDAIARRLVPGIAVVALAAYGIASGGAVLEDIPAQTAQAAEVAGDTAEAGAGSGTAANVTYQDGTYTGTAPGFGGDITVSVTIEGGKMTAIEIVSAAGETPSYLSRAKKIIDTMLETQSADVDVVSGATYSSNGIINAVKNALVKASGGTVSETTGSSGLGGGANGGGGGGSTSSTAFTDGDYKDGTYTGSASGYGGTITVSVSISGGKIASISVVSASGETASYLAKAKGVISKVISAQSPNVDVVSGATYSSNGILNAIKQALNKAKSGSTTTNSDDNNENDDDNTPAADPDRTYTDGTYTGTGEGYGGDVSVKVTILNARISAIDVVSAEDETPDFFARARTLIATILKKQTTTGVDTVSGATYSSNGILDAVKEALDKAAGE
ncbi:MAG: FMN-binding protein, partial [Eubacteriales bacterium]|nr:FMN-binding protein [Eubacteriales bacterium]